jgi:hypothetical protein
MGTDEDYGCYGGGGEDWHSFFFLFNSCMGYHDDEWSQILI